MKMLYRMIGCAAVALGGLASAPSLCAAQTAQPTSLVLYDAPDGTAQQKLGLAYAIMLRNLLGHFKAKVDLVPVQQYAAGMIQAHDASFYLGAYYANPLPQALLVEAASTSKPFVWFKYNIWDLTGDPSYNFSAQRGFTFTALRGMNATPSTSNPNPGFFDTVLYKNLQFVKYYSWDSNTNVINADPDVGVTTVTDPARAQSVVTIRDTVTGEQIPYAMRSGNFWYIADIPFSYIGPRDRYLVFADLLHDMVAIAHPVSHRAMVRLEDMSAQTDPNYVKRLTDTLRNRKIRFSMGTTPHYTDPLGVYNNGVPETIPLSQASGLRSALNYGLARGGEIVLHGYTHQYDSTRNPYTAATGDDYEFWNINTNAPVAEDSSAWASGRVQSAITELRGSGYTATAWETPHYRSSAVDSRAIATLFPTTYQRVVYFTADQPNFSASVGADYLAGQLYPYPISEDFYGQRVLPENCGNIEYDLSAIDPTSNVVYTWQDVYTNAQYALAVRDGFASFFFHPFLLDPSLNVPALSDFQSLVDGITKLGYTWTVPSRIAQ
jgi:uncharacterized protein YdaL